MTPSVHHHGGEAGLGMVNGLRGSQGNNPTGAAAEPLGGLCRGRRDPQSGRPIREYTWKACRTGSIRTGKPRSRPRTAENGLIRQRTRTSIHLRPKSAAEEGKTRAKATASEPDNHLVSPSERTPPRTCHRTPARDRGTHSRNGEPGPAHRAKKKKAPPGLPDGA